VLDTDEGGEALSRSVRIVPAFGADGRYQGMQLLGFGADSFARSCGFVDGDVVVEVNGVPAKDPDAFLAAIKVVREARRAVVVVRREGREVRIEVESTH
jgi:S1-C subfamily serine protease